MKKKQKKKKSKKTTDSIEKEESAEIDSKEPSVEPEDKGKSETGQSEHDTPANTDSEEKPIVDGEKAPVENELIEENKVDGESDDKTGASEKSVSAASKTLESPSADNKSDDQPLDQSVEAAGEDLQKLKIDTSSPDIKSPTVPSSAYSSEIPFPEIDRSNTAYPEAAKAEIASLKSKISQLEATISHLEQENFRLRDHGNDDYDDYATLNLTPGDNRPRTMSKTRKTSFVEIDLYGEASKISDIRRQMGQWKGWQVDMRGWRTHGIGPILEL